MKYSGRQTLIRWIKRISTATAIVLLLLVAGLHAYLKFWVSHMPGESYSGNPAHPRVETVELAARIRDYVEAFAYDRSVYNPDGLRKAAGQVRSGFEGIGITPFEQSYVIDQQLVMDRIRNRRHPSSLYGPYAIENQVVTNYWVQIEGTEKPGELLIFSAHYDTVPDSPGACDDAAGIAGVFEIARHLLENPPKVSVLLAVFTCEEYPVGTNGTGGSHQFADLLLAQRQKAALPPPIGILSLDTLGNFSEEPGSQAYPSPLGYYYPDKGNFVAFVGDGTSRGFVRNSVRLFRDVASIPSQGATIPTRLVGDVARSDHAPFIERGVPGLMVTDTANFRLPNNYHTPQDTPDKVDFIKVARTVEGLMHIARQWH